MSSENAEEKMVYLSNKLRNNGLPVSIRSTKTAIDAYNLIGEDDYTLLRSALRSVYVKNKYDLPVFDEAFAMTFMAKPAKTITKEIQRQTEHMSKTKINGNKFKISKKKVKGNSQLSKNPTEDLKDFAQKELTTDYEDLVKDRDILNRDLTTLNEFDQRVFDLCQELGKRIANKHSRRARLASSHKIDIRRTMRRNMKYGGVPIELVNVKPNLHKKEHLFLNDISGSCEWISSWFFMLMFACQSSFKHSRMFEFDNKSIETTEFLKEKYMVDAFAEIRMLRMRNAMVRGTSDMYSAFSSFMDQTNLSKKSYIIILSDCRDWAGPKVDGIPASVELIREMSKLSKKVIILNPEDKKKWDVVDSCVSLYRDAGAKIYEVSTLNQLADFVSSM
ncbi:MAG: VWA domain-containing protein [archaeon]|nr:VWA domain-containing protein [archaeon]